MPCDVTVPGNVIAISGKYGSSHAHKLHFIIKHTAFMSSAAETESYSPVKYKR